MYIKKIIAIIALAGIVVMGIFAYNVYNSIFGVNTTFNNAQAHVYIPTNASFNDVKNELSPFLKDMEAFEAIAKRKGYVNNVKSGHFIIEKGMNTNEIINTIRINNTPIKIAFNNQQRLQDLAGRVAAQIEADSISLINAMLAPEFLKKHGFTKQTALSMYIPNSYEVYWNTSATDFRDKMLKEYKKFWNTSRVASAKKLGLSKTEVYTVASIVQKETAKIDERPRVAGVYLNRLRIGMKLDADPTVIYAIRQSKKDWDLVVKRVFYKDLELQSPYNTYRNVGLPPGPIFMPDVSAIDAVLNHERHDYLYFVANINKIGYHTFAKNLSQHNANAASYRNWVARQGLKR